MLCSVRNPPSTFVCLSLSRTRSMSFLANRSVPSSTEMLRRLGRGVDPSAGGAESRCWAADTVDMHGWELFVRCARYASEGEGETSTVGDQGRVVLE